MAAPPGPPEPSAPTVTASGESARDLADAAKKIEMSQTQAIVTETAGVTEQTEAVTIQ